MRTLGAIIIGWVHLISVVIWIGGAFFFDLILQPAAAQLDPPQAGKLNQSTVQRFSPVAWGSIIIIIITGLIRAAGRGVLSLDVLFNTLYGNLLLGKIVLVVIMVIIGVIITMTGIRMMRLASSPEGPPREEILAAQARIKTLSEINLVLGFIAIFLAVGLRVIMP